MTRLKPFSLFRWINSRIELKLLAAILLVAIIFIPVTSFVSYQHAYDKAQDSALIKVSRLIKIVKYNAAMAAYLEDKQLGADIVYSLTSAPELQGVELTFLSGKSLQEGKTQGTPPDITIPLFPVFSDTPAGQLKIYINQEYINTQARDSGLSLMLWLSLLVVTILCSIFIIFRFVVTRPLNAFIRQVRHMKIDGMKPGQNINVRSADEIGFLADNTNQMLHKIYNFYRAEARKNAKIARLEQQFRMIFESSHAGIALVGMDDKIMLSNPSFIKLMLHNSPPVSAQEQLYLPDLFDQSDGLKELLVQVRQEGKNLSRDFCLKQNGNEEVWVRILFSLVDEQQDSQLGHFIELVVYDISDRAKKEKVFAYTATHDALTGLRNRRGAEASFNKQLEKARENAAHMVMIWLDLNDFKPINDTHGHDAGDVVLKELSARLLGISRPEDTVARWGGDEFVVAMCLSSLDRLVHILDELQSAFDDPVEISPDLAVHVGASIGVSTSLSVGYNIPSLLDRADKAMYEVKKSGKNGYRIDDIDAAKG